MAVPLEMSRHALIAKTKGAPIKRIEVKRKCSIGARKSGFLASGETA
jgi:hypothetical protein